MALTMNKKLSVILIFFLCLSRQIQSAFSSGTVLSKSFHDILDVQLVTDLYLSSSSLRPDYQDMLQNLKIFLYPSKSKDFGSLEHCQNLTATDMLKPAEFFYKTLAKSSFITQDPEEAHFYFLPFRVEKPELKSTSSVSRFLRRYIDEIKAEYPYWNQTLGADHFYISCSGIGIDSNRNLVELKKNAVQISCFPVPDFENSRFYAHKDIAMSPVGFGIDSNGDLAQPELYLAYSVSMVEGLEQWKNEPGFRLDENVPDSPSVYARILGFSRFCLVMFSSKGNPLFLVDALSAGCIPVIIANRPLFDIPFQDVLDWRKFVVAIDMSQLSQLRDLLQGIPEEKYQNMKKLAKEASKHLVWHSKPRPYDAFHNLMYQLWLRRHVIRYARRNVE